MSVPRPRIGLLVALVAALALLCCGGSVSALLLGGSEPEDATEFSLMGCGQGDPVDPNGEMPSVRAYGEEQMRNAAIIINVGKEMGLPPRAWVIAVATAMQESRLVNLGHLGTRNDHDSQGLFQQRPSAGWGTPAQVRDPEYASRKFYEKLKTVRGWQTTALTRAAQRVQRSAYPNAYAKHESTAAQIVNLLADGAANRAVDSTAEVCATGTEIAASGYTNPVRAMVGSGFRTRARPTHQGVDLIVGKGAPIVSVSSGVVSVVKCDEDRGGRQSCDVDGFPGKGGCGWMVEIVHAGNVMTRYCHLMERPTVRVGEQVTAGQNIGRVGSSGNSSGPHLHFEVHMNNDRTSRGAVNPVTFMRQQGSPLGGQA